jgi:hypothetical protein
MRVTLKKKKHSVLMILEPEERDMTGTMHDGKEVDDRRWDETTMEEDDGGVWRSQGTVRYISCTRESRWQMIGGKNGEGRWVRKKIVGERRNGNVVMK